MPYAERLSDHQGSGASECRTLSQQNTFTGRLTPAMLCEVLERAKDAAGL
jgi:hypothetical protein